MDEGSKHLSTASQQSSRGEKAKRRGARSFRQEGKHARTLKQKIIKSIIIDLSSLILVCATQELETIHP